MALLIWPDAVGMTALAVTGAIAVPIALLWFARSPRAAIIAMIVASATPRLAINIGGLNARPEHIVGGLMLLTVPFLRKKQGQQAAWIASDYWLLGYIFFNFFSSLFMSVQPGQTTKWAAQQVLAILPYFLLRFLITDRARLRWAFQVLLIVGTATVSYAVICFYANVAFGTELGVETAQYGDIPATFGLQYEANILGAFSGALAVMMLAMYIQERKTKYLVGFSCIGLVAMGASLSRAALGATLVGLALVGIYGLMRHLLNGKAIRSIALATVFAGLMIGPFVLSHYTERFSTVEIADPTADPNTMTRAVQTFSAFDEILSHPFFGGGTASFQLAFDWESLGAGWEDQGWIGNTELRVLHDTGVAGLIVFAGFVLSLVWNGWKALRRQSGPELVALLASACVYLISFQATEGTLLSFTWVHLGLIGCALSLFHKAHESEKKTFAEASAT